MTRRKFGRRKFDMCFSQGQLASFPVVTCIVNLRHHWQQSIVKLQVMFLLPLETRKVTCGNTDFKSKTLSPLSVVLYSTDSPWLYMSELLEASDGDSLCKCPDKLSLIIWKWIICSLFGSVLQDLKHCGNCWIRGLFFSAIYDTQDNYLWCWMKKEEKAFLLNTALTHNKCPLNCVMLVTGLWILTVQVSRGRLRHVLSLCITVTDTVVEGGRILPHILSEMFQSSTSICLPFSDVIMEKELKFITALHLAIGYRV